MARHKYGCACCNGLFGKMMHSNEGVRALKAKAGNGWSCNWGIDWGSVARRDFLKGGVAAAGLAALEPGKAEAQEATTTLFTGGTILTVDADFSEAKALAIRGERILAVGTEAEVRAAAGDGATVVDLAGRTMLPGFIDPHTHVVQGALAEAIMDNVGMARFSTADEVLAHIAERAAEAPAGEWLVFRNFDPAIQTGPEALTFAELDAVSNDHPIFVLNASGHLAYANSRAFGEAGITEDVSDPPGGEFVRDGSGALTGEMKNNIGLSGRFWTSYPALAEALNRLKALIDLLTVQVEPTRPHDGQRAGPRRAFAVTIADASVMFNAAQSGPAGSPHAFGPIPFTPSATEAWDKAGVKRQWATCNAIARIAGLQACRGRLQSGLTPVCSASRT